MGWHDNNSGCPCNGCGDLVPEPNCHGYCERYIAWSAVQHEKNEVARKERLNQDTISDAKKRALWRKKRYSRNARNWNTKVD